MNRNLDIYVIDTHSLVWYFTNSTSLSQRAAHVFGEIESGDSIGFVPTIVLAELMHLTERKERKGQSIGLNLAEALRRLSQYPYFRPVPLDLAILVVASRLTWSTDIHDRIIVATA